MSSTAATPARPVSASTRPTPLVQPATGPNAIDRAAFAEAIRTHAGTTADQGAVLPRGVADAMPERTTTESPRRQGWWARLIGSLRALFARA